MSNVIDTVSREVMIEDGCGCTVAETGDRVLCDDARLFEARESKCNCRSSAKSAIRATLEWYRDNVSEDMNEAAHKVISEGENYAHDKPLPTAKNVFRAMLSQAIKELDEETV